jgi:hypothetical protein
LCRSANGTKTKPPQRRLGRPTGQHVPLAQTDEEQPASTRLVFHKHACSGPGVAATASAASASEHQALAPPTPQSIVFPSSFSGGFVHSELDYGEWIGIRHKYQEQFCLAQPKHKLQAKAKARPARGQSSSKRGRRASPPTAAASASASSSSAPAIHTPLYRSAPSSLLYFDGFHTSLRIPGDALSFPGLAPYTIELCVFVPQQEALHADAEADSPLDFFGNSSSSGGGGGVGGGAVAGGLLPNTSHAARQYFFPKTRVSEDPSSSACTAWSSTRGTIRRRTCHCSLLLRPSVPDGWATSATRVTLLSVGAWVDLWTDMRPPQKAHTSG